MMFRMRNPLKEYVTVIDLSQLYGVTPRRIRAIAQNRKIVGDRVGNTLVYKTNQVVLFRPQPCGNSKKKGSKV